MPVIQQKINAVLFQLYGKRRALRNLLQHLNFANANLVSARCALLGPDFSRDNDARLLRQPLQRRKCLRALLQRANTLNDPGPIAKNRKQQLPRFPHVVKPPANRDFLPVVLPCLLDSDSGHSVIAIHTSEIPNSSLMVGYERTPDCACFGSSIAWCLPV